MVSSADTPSTNYLLTDLVSYHPAATNGSYPDEEGSNTGTIYGAVYSSSGKITGCHVYNGNDRVEISGTNYQTTGSWSVSLWMRLDGSNSSNIRMWSIGGRGDDTSLLRRSTNKIRFGIPGLSPSVVDCSTTLISSATWHHVVAIYNSSANTLTVYLNGSVDGSVGVSGTRTQSGYALIHGAAKYADTTLEEYFNGGLCEIGYWNKALASTDVSNLYNSGDGLSFSSFD